MPDSRPASGPPVEDTRPHRAIRSFVVRAGRMTVAQQRAWESSWPRYGIDTGDGMLDLDATFGRNAPRTLEIGFGNGETLVALAAAHPERDYLGIEVHRPGVGHLLLRVEELALSNVRIVCRDAVEVLTRCLQPASLDEVLLYFPDPWPKKRHHKRRIVQPSFVELVASRLAPGGVLRMATDWQPYAVHMLEVASACAALVNESAEGRCVDRPGSRPVTRFEGRGRRLGHDVSDLAFRRRAR
jgi:tRNA (guanine-N7-)-methyltransferase